jgi:hypothetical protein
MKSFTLIYHRKLKIQKIKTEREGEGEGEGESKKQLYHSLKRTVYAIDRNNK